MSCKRCIKRKPCVLTMVPVKRGGNDETNRGENRLYCARANLRNRYTVDGWRASTGSLL